MVTRIFLIDALRKRVNEKRMSCILLTSNANIASQFTDMIYIMYKGTIVESALSDRIFSGPLHPYTQALKEANSERIYHNSDYTNNNEIVISNSSVKPAGCLYHRVCPLAIRTCGWTAQELLEPLKYAITEQKFLNNESLPDLEKIEIDNEENLLELKFKGETHFEESNVKNFMENLFVLKSQRSGGVIFEAVKFIDFEQENHNLVIQMMDSYEPFFIEVEKDHRVACHLHSKTFAEKIEEREKEESKEIRFFHPEN
jgi:ABC-type dipeptide/oligopeptide/nickel transport system, ATPase component